MVAATASHPRDGSSPWNPTVESALPLPGELILLLANVRRLAFCYGPDSAVALTGAPSSAGHPSSVVPLPNVGPRVLTAASSASQTKKMTWHMWLVAEIDPGGNAVLFPVFSYSRAPKDHPQGQPWNADQWMRHTEKINQIHHVPIPAALDGELWEPLPNPHPHAPVVTIAEWKNNIPSWLALSPVDVTFTDPLPKWRRYHSGPLLVDNPEITGFRLSRFARSTILQWLRSKGYAVPQTNSLSVHPAIIPTFDSVWRDIYCRDDHNGAFNGDDRLSIHDGSGDDETHAQLDAPSSHPSDDNADRITDPLWIWNLFPRHPGMPKWDAEDPVLDSEKALQLLKEKTSTKVSEWQFSVGTDVAGAGGEGRKMDVHEDQTSFQEVEFGESAVP